METESFYFLKVDADDQIIDPKPEVDETQCKFANELLTNCLSKDSSLLQDVLKRIELITGLTVRFR